MGAAIAGLAAAKRVVATTATTAMRTARTLLTGRTENEGLFCLFMKSSTELTMRSCMIAAPGLLFRYRRVMDDAHRLSSIATYHRKGGEGIHPKT